VPARVGCREGMGDRLPPQDPLSGDAPNPSRN
jgi:hypothetical protein